MRHPIGLQKISDMVVFVVTLVGGRVRSNPVHCLASGSFLEGDSEDGVVLRWTLIHVTLWRAHDCAAWWEFMHHTSACDKRLSQDLVERPSSM